MKRLFLLALWFWPLTLFAANWYVRPSATGAKTGADWDNAWATTSLGWSNVKAGDTVWLAGGNYNGSFSVGASGSSGNPIVIKRAKSGDTLATGAAGWSSSLDAQAVFSGISFPTKNYVTIDGNQSPGVGIPANYGILVNVKNGGIGVDVLGVNTGLSIINIDVAGPGFHSTQNETNGISMAHGGDPAVNNILISKCRIRYLDTAIKLDNLNNSVIEYTTVQFISSGNMGAVHPDTMYWYPCKNVTVRYCYFGDVDSESIFAEYNGHDNIIYFANIMVQGTGSSSSGIEYKQDCTYGKIFLYNNTFVGWSKGIKVDSGATIAAGSTVQNNLFVNCTNGFSGTIKYNGYSGVNSVGSNATNNSSSPFTNASGGDYSLASGSWATDAGSGLPAPYNTDMNGNALNNSLGALGAKGSGGSTPTPIPTASPSPTAAPTPTPTPPPTVLPSPKFKVGDWVQSTDAINIRSTPGGTLMGAQPSGATGKVVDGPQIRSLNGVPVTWWGCAMTNSPSGWVGEDYLAPSAAPTATPSPSPSSTPDISFHSWLGKVNTKISADKPTEKQLNDWIKNNPAKAD